MFTTPSSEARAGNAVARWVSIIGHPFALSLVLILGVAARLSSPPEAAQAALLVIVLTLLPLGVLVARQVRRGSWAHVDASNRVERSTLLAAGLLVLAVLAVVATSVRPGSFLVRGAIGVFAMLWICALAAKWMRVSLHMAFGALAATTLLLVRSPVAWVLVPLVPALAWSRLSLRRHTAVEVVLGLLTGVVAGYAIVRL